MKAKLASKGQVWTRHYSSIPNPCLADSCTVVHNCSVDGVRRATTKAQIHQALYLEAPLTRVVHICEEVGIQLDIPFSSTYKRNRAGMAVEKKALWVAATQALLNRGYCLRCQRPNAARAAQGCAASAQATDDFAVEAIAIPD
jgi:hypothetical protein